MDLPTSTISNPIELHAHFARRPALSGLAWWFRGHAKKEWELIPLAGREGYYLPPSKAMPHRDLARFNVWRRRAVAYLKELPTNEWESLAIAQHHGLATRLLDWTLNPLVATFFACCEHFDDDGCVYCYSPSSFVDEDILPLDAEVNGVGYMARAIAPRILNQRGVFTVHGPPTERLMPGPHPSFDDESSLAQIVIPSKLKWETLRHLDNYGVNRSTLFPELDGLSTHINYETQDIVRMAKKFGIE